ncbi:hypothetical protein [Bacillus thuringiensis]|uniref:hypothetical protein n=1 Tax=Bacillus thuringiensis TaxID=1428 RepID=UPI00211D19C2|nr:hypothetical protein [Bacillus thuringiensis]
MDTVPNFNLGRYQEYVDVMLVILPAAGVVSNPNAVNGLLTNNMKETINNGLHCRYFSS